MTIIAAISASRQGTAPLHLAAQIARSTGDKIVAAAIVERPWPPRDDPVEDEYLRLCHLAGQRSSLEQSGRQAAGRSRHLGRRAPINLCPNRFDGSCRRQNGADLVVVGSSSSGTAGPGGVGQCDRPAGAYRGSAGGDCPARLPDVCPTRYSRLTAAYGGQADVNGLIATSAELAKQWSVAIADRVVHGAAGDGCSRGSIEPRPRTLSSNSGRAGLRRDRQAAQRMFATASRFPTSRSWSAPATIGARRWKMFPGKPATCCCWDRGQPDRPLRYSSARPPRRSCATPRCP